ncbi:hypothetical protein BST92_11795 [Nonlabens arenilitoris]|uniref:Uncharacterized protein n=1 Tax=Nonlabens arenilitoris TaxID=1217969 RepID=A0A2S7UCA3_9FLAO|nr:hypothetical protein [Nonlabens arenilitoris]PQJ32565.1 hypothetical protein BST92_11795 [Nonlabens arenilitoris]
MKNIEFIRLIKLKFPEIEFKEIESNDEICLEFRTLYCKSFKFRIWVESLWTTTNLLAILDSEPDSYFWYDEIMFNPSSNDVDDEWIDETKLEIIRALDIFIKRPIRITQRKKWFATSFKCEYYDNKWIDIGKRILFSGGRVPKISGRKKIYD